MKHRSPRTVPAVAAVVAACVVMLTAATAHAQTILRVDASSTDPAPDGATWPKSFTHLQDALAAAAGIASPATPVRIWVAKGTYMPDGGRIPDGGAHIPGSADRIATFQLVNDVVIEGGYAGIGEPVPDARIVGSYETILSGDLAGDDSPDFANNDENGYHVVTGTETDQTAVLDGVTITAGNAIDLNFPFNAGGGMYNVGGSSPTLSNCTFSGNRAGFAGGGGMYNTDGSSPMLTNCTFDGNTATQYGGGVYNSSSSPTLTDCTFSGNTAASRGGGMFNTFSSPTLTNCTLNANMASQGGGVFNIDGSNSMLTDCMFSVNTASDGGGMFNFEGSSPTLTDCTFSNNTTRFRGGGMYNVDGSSPTLTNCIFDGNTATTSDGGGMSNENSSNPMLTNCTFIENTSGDDGGGMFNFISSPTVTDCTFSGGTARFGGGMYNITGSNPTVINCTFSSNTVSFFGGGMYNTAGSSPTVTNCTFSENTARYGGGMQNRSINTSPTVTNCTFNGNISTFNGGGMANDVGSSPTLINCILWGNMATIGDHEIFNASSIPRITFCDIAGSGGSAAWDASLGTDGGGNIDADPNFVRQPDDGGDGFGDDPSTPNVDEGANDDFGDLRLSPGSPCIDAGDNSAVPADAFDLDGDGDLTEPIPFDLDGLARFIDDPLTPDTGVGTPPIVDMGAYEFLPPIPIAVDVRPEECPNSLNRRNRGAFPVAVVGGDDFDVSMIDSATITLSRADGVGNGIGPIAGPPGPHIVVEDVTGPAGDGPCPCDDAGADGVDDLLMMFSTPDLVAALQLDTFSRDEFVEVVVRGALVDGRSFVGSDCLRILGTADRAMRLRVSR